MRTVAATFGRFIAAFLTLAMLTSSIAMAAYSCPKVAGELGMVMDMAMTSHTAAMDDQMPVHCAERQAGDKQALEHSGSAPGPALPAVVTVQLISPALLPAWKALPVEAPVVLPGHPQPFLRTQRLRI
ncbi:MAG: hypothetical protein NBV65_06745 [Burkholderiaceae bacterium]|nr:hypothetical protein [Burkholderiaceae bacterium]